MEYSAFPQWIFLTWTRGKAEKCNCAEHPVEVDFHSKMKKRILFYAALSVSLLSLVTIIVMAAGISSTAADREFGIRISYITSVSLIGFTAGMALNIYYFITADGSNGLGTSTERTRRLEEICIYGNEEEDDDGSYTLLMIRPSARTSLHQVAETLGDSKGCLFACHGGRLFTLITADDGKDPSVIAERMARSCGEQKWSIAYYPEPVSASLLHEAYITTEKTADNLFFREPGSIAEAEKEEDRTIPYARLLQEIEEAMQNLRKDNMDPLLHVLDSTAGNMMACRFAFFMISSLLDQQRLSVNPSMRPGTMDVRDFPSFIALRAYVNERANEYLRDLDARAENRQQSYAERINSLIQDHLADSGYGVQQIAEDLDLSPAYLSRIYKEKTGRNIIDAITELRLHKAEELLSDTDKTITEICMETGYSSSSYFHRVFRKKHLISPGEYRQRMKENGR